MCRIYGHLRESAGPANLAAVPGLLRHGGPDGEWSAAGPGWTLGATRLALVDLAGGQQPYRLDLPGCPDADAIRVVFNGEIYNHAALRTRLATAGYRFADRCDGSILPALYHRYGVSFADHLDGMYAVAVLDLGSEPTLVLATDGAGMKPVYYHQDNRGGVSFASEIPALLAVPGVTSNPWPAGLDAYLTTRAPFGEQTMFADIRVLPRATTAVFTSRTGLTLRRRRSAGGGAEAPADLTGAAVAVREELRRQTHRLAEADVPVAAICSGGLDSSLVTALLAERVPDLQAFHIGYRGRWPFDEREFARAVADRSGATLRWVELDPATLPDLLPAVVNHLGQPNADPITASTYTLFRAVRDAGFKAALTGDAADEVFGGYDRIKAAAGGGRGWIERYVGALAAVPRELRDRLYSPDYREYLHATGTAERALVDRLRADRRTPLDAITDLELDARLPAYHLRRVDHLSMASGVEVRLPFCQPSVVRLAAALPAELRVSGDAGKRALYGAAEGLLPPSVLERPKQPFTLPIAAMLRSGSALFRYAREVLAADEVGTSGQLDPRAVTALLDAHAARPTDGGALAIWSLTVYQLWFRRFVSQPAGRTHSRTAAA